jgi:uncharacterized protein (DUF1778 family)
MVFNYCTVIFRTFFNKYGYFPYICKNINTMRTLKQEKTRFDTRLPKDQKQLFERAAYLGGYRSLTDFVIVTVQNRAKEIIGESEKIIASQRDNEIFFKALMNPEEPNRELLSATDEYKKLTSDSQ